MDEFLNFSGEFQGVPGMNFYEWAPGIASGREWLSLKLLGLGYGRGDGLPQSGAEAASLGKQSVDL